MKVAVKFVLFFFLGTMFVGLFHMSHMDMHTGMPDCPFMAHEEVLCPMNLMDHVGAWKSTFLSIMPSLILLLAATGGVLLAAIQAPNLLRRVHYTSPPLARSIREKVYSFYYRALQELFSKGILKPKLY